MTDRIAFAFLWLFVFCVPWAESPVVPDRLSLSHGIGILAGLAGIVACVAARRVRKPGPALYVAAAFVVWPALSCFWSVAPELSLARAVSYIQLLLMVWLIWQFAPADGRQLGLLASFVLGSAALAAANLYALYQGAELAVGDEPGIVLALALAASCHLLVRAKSPRLLWLLCVPLFLFAIPLTASRPAVVAAALGLLILPLGFDVFTLKQRLFGGLALVALSAAALSLLPAATWENLRSPEPEAAETATAKESVVRAAALDAFRAHPVAGVGAGTFEATVQRRLGIPFAAPNSYLSLLVELGAAGFVLFLALLAALCLETFSLHYPSNWAWAILLSVWSFSVFWLVWEYRKPTWFLFGLLIAQAAALRRPNLAALQRAHAAEMAARPAPYLAYVVPKKQPARNA